MTTRSVVFGLALLAVACTGSEFANDSSDSAADGSAAGAGGGSSTGGGAGLAGAAGASVDAGGSPDAAAPDAAPDAEHDATVDAEIDCATGALASDSGAPDAFGDGGGLDANPACVLVAYFLDGDGDGFGGTTTVSAYAKPDGAWVTTGGDCDDGNPIVHPAQASYFTVGYVKTGGSEVSFDYDCSGVEKEAGSSPKAACQVQGLGCVGGGYIFATPFRSGPGVNPYCGSEQRVNCNYVTLKCSQSAPFGAPAIACR